MRWSYFEFDISITTLSERLVMFHPLFHKFLSDRTLVAFVNADLLALYAILKSNNFPTVWERWHFSQKWKKQLQIVLIDGGDNSLLYFSNLFFGLWL